LQNYKREGRGEVGKRYEKWQPKDTFSLKKREEIQKPM
jgi:hypothetical protein